MKRKLFSILGLIIVTPLCFILLGRVKQNKQAQKSIQVVIQLDNGGFSPKILTVTRGTIVRWKNVSGAPQTVNSNDYPTNQLHRELNFGVFNTGSTFVYVFSTPGTYTYHNQLHPEQQGTITVTK
jgi:plastocyanin